MQPITLTNKAGQVEALPVIGKRVLGHEPDMWHLRAIQRYAQAISNTTQQPYKLTMADGTTFYRIKPAKR